MERPARFQRVDQVAGGRLALAAHDDVDLRLRIEDVPPMIGWKHAAIDDARTRYRGAQHAGQIGDDRVCRRGTRMPKHYYIGSGCSGGTHDVAKRHRTKFGIDELNVVTVVDERPTDGQESEWRQLLARDTAADRWMRRIDNQDTHVDVTSQRRRSR